MSIAGIRSNRGDGYQTLVAFDWALSVLSKSDYQWIEVDSVDWPVDDVVIGKSDGTLICCQCKKNQPDFKNWSIADLSEEIGKAVELLSNDPNAQVRFYSRSPFGPLAKLRELCTAQPDEASYLASLPPRQRPTNETLIQHLQDKISSYAFLRRVTFENSPEFDRMEELLFERLLYIACNPKVAFTTLWTRLDQLGARIEGISGASASTQHRLTKEDLKTLLNEAGVILAPSMDVAEVRTVFAGTSAVGRQWIRDIAELRIVNPVLEDLLVAISQKKRTILLTGQAGSGKTCALLDLQEKLEAQSRACNDLVPIFIQSREFAEMTTVQERQAQGLPEDWVEKIARLAESVYVVVVVDSLDVLSIAREHAVLTYFLSQIDRLLLIPNITIVTACREFDRYYDRSLAVRKWDCELKCNPLDWEAQVAPLLENLGIDIATIDTITRSLIQNPRELAIFVELADREGGFSVVTGQALAQRYLDTIVRAEQGLGESAMEAIECMAAEMLARRSLSIPPQRFTASLEVCRALLSQKILHETQDGKLAFGHQTLIDVLVISGAIRKGLTLNEFIQRLPPVPFVRPSIRSFVAQLVTVERKEFRKQLRAVFSSNMAFHIRRLVAESFAEQLPQEDDWPMIFDLRKDHREIFQVIYQHASAIEWHQFWLKYLVPLLKEVQDAGGFTAHVYRISQWKNQDAKGVFESWCEALASDWLDRDHIAEQLGFYLSDTRAENLALLEPLLRILLKLPRNEYGFLGGTLARCVTAGVTGDDLLWHYVAGSVTDSDVEDLGLNNKLHCQPHELGQTEGNFLADRMRHSVALLDMALASVERWSQAKDKGYGETLISYWSGFLSDTSYRYVHQRHDFQSNDGMNILLDSIETAVLQHAREQSPWWIDNRKRLSFSHEAALRYFAILACTASPESNLDQVGEMLCDKDMLASDLSYELGTLINSAFIYLEKSKQLTVLVGILAIHEVDSKLRKRAELISAVPCHLRSPDAQALLDAYEDMAGAMIRQPQIISSGGWVAPPFPFSVFLGLSDLGVLRLLKHYEEHSRSRDIDSLTGGKEEVGWQLREAASRSPTRFMCLLSSQWGVIDERFRNDIIDGVATYLAYRYGNLQINGEWIPIEEPDAINLARQILDALERHPSHWHNNRSASNALQACSHVIEETKTAERLVFMALGFTTLREDDSLRGGDLLTTGINMVRGHVAEAVMILANRFLEKGIPWPDLLSPTLGRLACDEHPAIRALVLRRLPHLQYHLQELGWSMFDRAMQEPEGLWGIAEPCLYHSYYQHFERVEPFLKRLRQEGKGADLETWGRISALAALSKRIDFVALLQDLKSLDATEAWKGTAKVLTHPQNINQYQERCFEGIEAGLNAGKPHALVVAQEVESLFRNDGLAIHIPISLLSRCFEVLEGENDAKYHILFGFTKWLNIIAQRSPEEALASTEIYLNFMIAVKANAYDYDNQLTQVLTRLFSEAEEREESDHGAMLRRVVILQDTMLSLGVNGIGDWLRAAERP